MFFPVPSVHNFEAETETYCANNNITDRGVKCSINRFVRGLKDLGVWANVDELVLLASGYNSAVPKTFLGNTALGGVVGALQKYGLKGDTTSANHASFPISNIVNGTIVGWLSGDRVGAAQYCKLLRLRNAATNQGLSLWHSNRSDQLEVLYGGTGIGASLLSPGVAGKLITPKQWAMTWDNSTGDYGWSVDGGAITSNSNAGGGMSDTDHVEFAARGGIYQGVAVFNIELDAAQLAAVDKLARTSFFTAGLRIIGEGDSLMAGADEWMEMLLTKDGWNGIGRFHNIAAGGERANQIRTQAEAGSFLAYSPTAVFPKTWAVIQCGANDLALFDNIDRPNQDILDDIEAIAGYARAAGCVKVIVCTVTKGAGIDARGRLADCDVVNTAVKAFTTANNVDHVLDVDGMFSALDASYWTNTAYFDVDQIHPNDTGRGLMADLFDAEISNLR